VSTNENASQKTPRKRGGNGNAKAPIEDRFAAGHDFLLINHDIDDALFSDVLGRVTEHKKNTKAVVLLITYGGSANVAYRVARFLQTMYEHIVVCVPSVCKSAGTLIAAAIASCVWASER
jgi:ClpP class serine protease